MTVSEIERLLESQHRVGFRKPIDDHDFLGWLLVAKVRPNVRLLEVADEREFPLLVQEERRRLEKPYLLLDLELRRSVHEAGDYEAECDYRRKEAQWFARLGDVADALQRLGYRLDEAQDARELDAP